MEHDTSLVPELAALPDGLAVDGELVAFGDDGLPSFPRLCNRMLQGQRRIDVMLIVFDVLAIDGQSVYRQPCWERRLLLEDLALDGDYWSTTFSLTDGEAYGSGSATSAWKASSPRNAAATTSRAGEDGSRSRTARTGPTHSNWKR